MSPNPRPGGITQTAVCEDEEVGVDAHAKGRKNLIRSWLKFSRRKGNKSRQGTESYLQPAYPSCRWNDD